MHRIDVHKLADEAKFNRIHFVVLFWCFLIVIADGYDLAVAGIALPAVMKDMKVGPTTTCFMASSALFGMMFGAIFLGTIGDKIGRRWAISISVLLFSIFTAAAAFTRDPANAFYRLPGHRSRHSVRSGADDRVRAEESPQPARHGDDLWLRGRKSAGDPCSASSSSKPMDGNRRSWRPEPLWC